ncbi:MAG TPA: fluoride efflux transporter CrcB [Prolixibacteraceae bacterium]|nr:fluoride efflux transporter CrcB [Prolixibacteraceae bacterium]
MLRNLLIVGAGGFIGSSLRYISQLAVDKWVLTNFPLGTFVVNIVGCFIIGAFYGLAERGNFLSAELRLFLAVGFCGGFTTFSAFAADSLNLLKTNAPMLMLINVVGSVVLGVFAVYLGIILLRSIL